MMDSESLDDPPEWYALDQVMQRDRAALRMMLHPAMMSVPRVCAASGVQVSEAVFEAVTPNPSPSASVDAALDRAYAYVVRRWPAKMARIRAALDADEQWWEREQAAARQRQRSRQRERTG